jgi:hypothetical protein
MYQNMLQEKYSKKNNNQVNIWDIQMPGYDIERILFRGLSK